MPLVATVAGRRLEAWAITADEWTALKSSYRQLELTMTCGQGGVPKTSPRGKQFFAHKPNAHCQLHDGGPETPEHLAAKAVIAAAARAAGWSATVEYAAPDRSWIADVLVERGSRRVAIEVQWSPQTEADFQHRQTRYTDAGLECFWLAGPSNARTAQPVPSYALSGTPDQLEILLPHSISGNRHHLELGEGIMQLLTGAIANRVEAITTGLEIATSMLKCWRQECGRWMTLWYLTGAVAESRCGQRSLAVAPWASYQRWAARRIETQVQEAVVSAVQPSDLPPAVRFAERFSKELNQHYQAALCPSCGVHQGDAYVPRNGRWTAYRIPFTGRFPFSSIVTEVRHLCVDVGRGRCAPGPPSPELAFPPPDRASLRMFAAAYQAPPLPPRQAQRTRSG